MGNAWAVLIPTGIVLVVAVIGWLSSPRAADRRMARLADRARLELDEDTAPIVRRRLRRRNRAMMLGMVAGSLAGTLPALALDRFDVAGAWWAAVYLTGVGVGALVVHVVDTGRTATEPGPRAAVLRPRRLHDFLHPAEIVAPYLAFVLPAAVLLLVVTDASGSWPDDRASWLVAGVGVAALVTVAATVAQRYVLHMAPPATSTARLKCEDALRGIALRDLGVTAYGTSLVVGAIATFGGLGDALADHPSVHTAAQLLVAVFLLGLVGLGVAAEYLTAPARRFLRLYQDEPYGAPR